MGHETRFLIPRDGLIVRDPVTLTPLPAGGAQKPWLGPEGRYWRRRLRCGDVSVGSTPVVRKEAPKRSFNNKEEDD